MPNCLTIHTELPSKTAWIMRQFSMNRKTVRTIPVAKPPKTGSLLPNGKRLSYKFRHSTRVINDRGIPFVPQSGCFFPVTLLPAVLVSHERSRCRS